MQIVDGKDYLSEVKDLIIEYSRRLGRDQIIRWELDLIDRRGEKLKSISKNLLQKRAGLNCFYRSL